MNKNKYHFIDNILILEINSIKNGKVNVLLDPEDFEKVNKLHWTTDGYGYIVSSKREDGKRTCFKIHRLIMSPPQDKSVDHINHNLQDNRKTNLRVCSHRENLRNQKPQKIKKYSKYKGVTWDKSRDKWVAKIKFDQKTINLGRFDCEKYAAKVYNEAAQKFFGSFCFLNILGE